MDGALKKRAYVLVDESQDYPKAAAFTFLLKSAKKLTVIAAGVPPYESISGSFQLRKQPEHLFLTLEELETEGILKYFYKKKKKKKRKTRSHQTISSRSRSISKKRIRKLALWKLIGKQLVAIALEHGHSWEECLMGFYDSWSDGDLPVAEFHRAHEWFQTHFIFHSLGRERGEDMGKLHTQGHGATLAPATKAGCTAMAQKYKEDMNIVTHSRRKVQFKLMEAGQPEDKMCAYTRKWRSFHEFLFVSSDRNNAAYTEDYLDHCDDKYRVQFTQNGLDYF